MKLLPLIAWNYNWGLGGLMLSRNDSTPTPNRFNNQRQRVKLVKLYLQKFANRCDLSINNTSTAFLLNLRRKNVGYLTSILLAFKVVNIKYTGKQSTMLYKYKEMYQSNPFYMSFVRSAFLFFLSP